MGIKLKKGKQLESEADLVELLFKSAPYWHDVNEVFFTFDSAQYYDTNPRAFERYYYAEECKYSLTNEEKRPEFEKVVKPVIEFLNNYYHPHAQITIDSGSAEISEGVMTMKTVEFYKD